MGPLERAKAMRAVSAGPAQSESRAPEESTGLGFQRLPRRKGRYADSLRTYLKIAAQLPDDRVLDRLVLRTSSRRAIDLLALRATHGRMRLSEVLEHVSVRGTTLKTIAQVSGGIVDPVHLVRLARALALQAHEEADADQALSIMHWVYTQAGAEAFHSDHARLYQNLSFAAGEYATAKDLARSLKLTRVDRRMALADLHNPYGSVPSADEPTWRMHFSEVFEKSGVAAPVHLHDGALAPFDRLAAAPVSAVDQGPLVTVIVTTWCPDQGLVTAVRSLLQQSWRPLEILIVDDASPVEFTPLLEEVCAQDPRIRLIRMPVNGGTYLARNAGLREARGDFVTGQDSDDWSHPRRIELQVRKLLKNAHLVSTTSHAVRCDPTLVFNAPGMMAVRENASSLMFRRTPVLERLGGYDDTRKGGDTEFMLRMARAFGERSHRVLGQYLALIRTSRASLSSSEFRPGWRHPSRSAYRRAYEFWHSRCWGEPELLRLQGSGARAFPIPARFQIASQSTEDAFVATHDVVFGDDLRGVGNLSHLRALLDEVNVAVSRGFRVGLLHLRSLRDMSIEPIDRYWEPLSRLIHDGVVAEVLATDSDHVGRLVIRRPEVVMFLGPGRMQLRAKTIRVIAEEPVVNSDGRVWYDPAACQRNLKDAFGVAAMWRASAIARPGVAAVLGEGCLYARDHEPTVHAVSWRAPARLLEGRRPVIGRILQGLPGELPERVEDLLAAYPPDGKLPVRFLGSEEQLAAILRGRELPRSWSFYDPATTDPELFLAGCDFYVHYNSEPSAAPDALHALRAMASGCVVLMPPGQAQHLEGSVVAADIDDVVHVIARFARDSGAFIDQVVRGRRYLSARMDWLEAAATAPKRRANPSVQPSSAFQLPARGTAVLIDHARRALRGADGHSLSKDTERLDATILRTGSENGRELLAWLASRGELSLSEIKRHAEAFRSGARKHAARSALGGLDPAFAIRLARILVLQSLRPDDRLNGLSIFEAVVDTHGAAVVPRKWGRLLFDTAVGLGRFGLAAAWLKSLDFHSQDRLLAAIDLQHPDVLGADEPQWLGAFNELFVRWGLEGMGLLPPAVNRTRFDRIVFDSVEPSVRTSEALVSVVVTAWRPNEALISSLRSIVAQSWTNVEIIVVDDASPPGYMSIFDQCRQLDPRIRIIHQAVNQGTYVARNAAMDVASGDFITFQDSDDYSHPRRIELQALKLLDDASLMATRSSAVRIDSRAVLAQPGSASIQGNASSLMIRRRPVLERVGFFDSVRKAADTEYALRIAAAFDVPTLELEPKQPLALVRVESNSLSRAEFRPGWRHPARSAYREAYELWHQEIRAGSASAFLGSEVGARRFPAPSRFSVDRTISPEPFDVVFCGDWRQFGGPQKSMFEEIQALHDEGKRIAVCQMEAFRFMGKEKLPLCEPVRRLIHEGVVTQLNTSDDVAVSLVILRYPPILQFSEAGRCKWRITRAVLVANQAPSEMDGSDVRYNVTDCIANARQLLGIDPVWAPQGPHVRAALEPLLPSSLLDPSDMPGILRLEDWQCTRARITGSRPVIGRYSRDHALKFPERAEDLLAAYPETDDIDVRIMGGLKTCPAILDGHIPANWALSAYGSQDVKDFLDGLDFFVYFDNENIVEAFGRSILEAIASGCLVILPDKFKAVFGVGATYCEPGEVAALVRSLHADPEEYERRRQQAMDHVRSHFSHESYVSRVQALLGAGHQSEQVQ
ncbi:glycosyltransferase [Novilysobacter selenitireducens]|uniref:Glycosyltransferase n=1 Tax=Novilysobacter selenitireducens TaxID=2872639 RepID=A0ABS7T3F2_9GAMM|nr:glycosyltransferase [Lysobacter selenitireducens]MBZ4038396.1 glycosyltransferase [Lysobacter selenitireducens]